MENINPLYSNQPILAPMLPVIDYFECTPEGLQALKDLSTHSIIQSYETSYMLVRQRNGFEKRLPILVVYHNPHIETQLPVAENNQIEGAKDGNTRDKHKR